jgi:hypothetical protein
MHFDTVRANAAKLGTDSPYIKEKVDAHFFNLNILGPSRNNKPLIFSTNTIAVFLSMGDLLRSTAR